MFESVFKSNLLLLQYAGMLTSDIPDERWTEQPLAGVNHPAWILGHLAYSADGVPFLLGGERSLGAEWIAKYGPGSKLTSLRSDYPPREALIGTLTSTFAKAREVLAAATAEQLTRPSTNPRMKDALPQIQDVCTFLLTAHLGVHLGQLSTWRRMIGLPPLF